MKMKSKEERTCIESSGTTAIMLVDSGFSVSPAKHAQQESRKRSSRQARTEAALSQAEAFITPRRSIISEPSSPVASQDMNTDYYRPT